MAVGINKVFLLGNLGRDPEARETKDGNTIVSFTMATAERWKDRQTGEWKDRSEWHKVVVYSPQMAELIQKYAHKGTKVVVEGKLVTRKWQDRSGQDRYQTEVQVPVFGGSIVLVDKPGKAHLHQDDSPRHETPAQPAASSASDLDDDIPF